jgi:hypothetical protein
MPDNDMPKKTDQDLIRLLRETEKLSLREIRLQESHCKLGNLKPEALPSRASQAINLSIEVNPADAAVVVATATCTLVFSYGDSEEIEPPVMLSASFRLQYALSKPISRKRLEETVPGVAMLNIWPYWRELAQSMTVRMGLPAFHMPLFTPAQLAKANPAAGEAKPK